jgi:hypothetical protein
MLWIRRIMEIYARGALISLYKLILIYNLFTYSKLVGMNNNNNRYTKMVAVILIAATTTTILTSLQRAEAFLMPVEDRSGEKKAAAPIATSGNNVYIAWWSNKTGNDEVMFKASTDGGKTFGDKMNLSNSTNAESQDAQIAASENNVYVSWWERNQTANEPALRVSNDNGKTFGERILLSNK